MLGGAPGTAASIAAATILVAEGGTHALGWGFACYVVLGSLWVVVGVVHAWWLLRGRVPIVPWRPNLMFKVYPVSRRNLLERVSRRMDALSVAALTKKSDESHHHKEHPAEHNNKHELTPQKYAHSNPHRVFGAVVGTCPFTHIGGASLANAALKDAPKKAPLYHAFAAFAGDGIFTAEGNDWSDKRTEVLNSFATVGLEPLAEVSVKVARRLTRMMDDAVGVEQQSKPQDTNHTEMQMLPLLQRATLRATFEYLAGCSIDDAALKLGSSGNSDISPDDDTCHTSTSPVSAKTLENEYLEAATSLRHLIPARARSVWILSDWVYGLSPVGRLETKMIRQARRLPLLALRAARTGSPLAVLAKGRAHGGKGDENGQQNNKIKSVWLSYMGFDVFVEKEKAHRGWQKTWNPPKALLDEAVTLLFAGHDTQSATLSWALLRLANDEHAQTNLRLGLRANCFDDFKIAQELGVDDLLNEGEHSTAYPSRRKNNSNAYPQPAWRTSRAAPALEAVLRETLRLHPVAPLVVRNLTSDAVGEDVTLPAGTAVGVWLHAVHRDPRVWDSAYEFKPERWLTDEKDSSEETKQGVKRKGSAFMPFATGPRACVGQHLAWVFMRVTLARLITAYEFQPCDNEDMTPSVGFTVTPASAAKMRVRKL
tara:strand:+ start:20412 stop:22373 length:1962 start_codon:yes stop_codon:yes gene_type:complete